MFRIKELRENRGISMREASRLLNMPYTTYVNYEKGLREPTSEVLIQLANFYDTSVDYIVGRTVRESNADCVAQPHSGKITPMPALRNISAVEEGKNFVRIAGRDGSYQERYLTDEQLIALKAIIDQLPDAPDDI